MQTLGYEICLTARKIYQHLNALFEPLDITPEQWILIKALIHQGGISQKELALKVRKDQNTTKAIVDKLVDKGYIHRVSNPMDRRAFILTPTLKAKEVAPKLKSLDEQMLQTLQNNISKEEINSFLATLFKLKDNITL